MIGVFQAVILNKETNLEGKKNAAKSLLADFQSAIKAQDVGTLGQILDDKFISALVAQEIEPFINFPIARDETMIDVLLSGINVKPSIATLTFKQGEQDVPIHNVLTRILEKRDISKPDMFDDDVRVKVFGFLAAIVNNATSIGLEENVANDIATKLKESATHDSAIQQFLQSQQTPPTQEKRFEAG